MTIETGITNVNAYKYGQVAMIKIGGVEVTGESGGWVIIGTLPNELRPIKNIHTLCADDAQRSSINMYSTTVQITTDGRVYIFMPTDKSSITARIVITYITAN